MFQLCRGTSSRDGLAMAEPAHSTGNEQESVEVVGPAVFPCAFAARRRGLWVSSTGQLAPVRRQEAAGISPCDRSSRNWNLLNVPAPPPCGSLHIGRRGFCVREWPRCCGNEAQVDPSFAYMQIAIVIATARDAANCKEHPGGHQPASPVSPCRRS